MAMMGRNAVLFIDNCSAHSVATDVLTNVRVVFLPPNLTSHLQPMNAGIIRCVKHAYHKLVLHRRLTHMKHGQGTYTVSVLDALHYVVSSGTVHPHHN